MNEMNTADRQPAGGRRVPADGIADRRRPARRGRWSESRRWPTVVRAGQAGGRRRSGGNGKIYIGTYKGDIQIFDEATEKLDGSIVLKTGLPRSLTPSQDRTRFYVLDSTFEKLEVVDIATRKTLNTFELSSGNKHTRVTSLVADPLNRYLVLLTRTATKLIDRWEIGPPTLNQFDLASGQVTRTIPWPKGEERETVSLRFSPDGKFLYFFGDDVTILETEKFTEVETWPFATPSEGGLGRINLGPVSDFYDAPGTFTGLFTMQDPVQKRRIMGIGKVDLTARKIDFRPIGPAEQVSFAQAPDHKRAYGIKSDIGRYEFWTFDLENARVISRGGVQGPAARGAARELERQDHLRLHRRRHDRPLRRRHLQVSAHHSHGRRPDDRTLRRARCPRLQRPLRVS